VVSTTPPRHPALGAVLLGALLLVALGAGRALSDRAVDARLAALGFTRDEIRLAVPSERAVVAPVRPASPPPPPTPAPTRAQIAPRVGFTPKVPSFLPPGYSPGGFELVTVDGAETPRVSWRAAPERRDRLCAVGLALVQEPAARPPSFAFRIGAARALVATVAGAPGVWVEDVPAGTCLGTHPDGRTESGTLVADVLAWERGGVRYRLTGDGALPHEQLVRVAESLT
jgi:hypothetical protein